MKSSATGIAITHRKTSTSSRSIRSGYSSTTIGSRTGPRRALGTAAQPARRGYRSDLRAVSVYLGLTPFIFDPLLLRKTRILVRTHWRRLRAS